MPDQTKSKFPPSARPHVLTWWYGLMAIGGTAFGLIGERRPFGQGFLAHPLVAFFIVVGVGLLALRFALARPVPGVFWSATGSASIWRRCADAANTCAT